MKKIRKFLTSAMFGLCIFYFGGCASVATVETVVSAAVIGATAVKTVSSVSKALEVFTPEQEYTIGLSVANSVCKIYTPVIKTEASIYLNKICRALTINSADPYAFKGYHVIIVQSDDFNALSTPGGHIFITDGLLKSVTSEDELAAIIAHEIAHIQLKHSIKSIKSKRTSKAVDSVIELTSTVDLVASGDFSAKKEMDNNTSDLTKIMFDSGFSKKQEFEADALAVKLLFDSGYNPEAMNTMFTHLEEERIKSNKRKSLGKTIINSVGFADRLMNNKLRESDYKSLNKTHPKPMKRMQNVNKILPEYVEINSEFYDDMRVHRFETNKILF